MERRTNGPQPQRCAREKVPSQASLSELRPCLPSPEAPSYIWICPHRAVTISTLGSGEWSLPSVVLRLLCSLTPSKVEANGISRPLDRVLDYGALG